MPNIKFIPGKGPPTIDTRSLRMTTILKVPFPTIPETFNVDAAYPNLVDTNMFLNNKYGDCVTASHAHQTFRFEYFEQGNQITITDNEVKAQYFKETGGSDTGLDMLASLSEWRKNGWVVGGKVYKIHAFATIDWKNHDEVKLGCMLFNGVHFGMQVPQSAINQTNKGSPWTLVANDGGNQGGHAVYKIKWQKVTTINEIGPVCVTWGIEQQMSWDFWDKYVDEAYIIIDERDSWLDPTTSPLNIPLLEQYLAQIGNTPSQKIAITTLSLPVGYIKKLYSASLGATGGTPPYSWTVNGGSLPIGLSLSGDGTLSGTPTTKGKYSITFMVNDSIGNASGIILVLTIKKKCFGR